MALVLFAGLCLPSTASAGHMLDHVVPSGGAPGPPSAAYTSGGPGAQWELLETVTTGNPHTDLDFFTQGGDTFASVGTLGIGANGGGQTIVRLTQDGQVAPGFVSAHPSASCLSNPAAATGLQHDVEATPKGRTILNTPNPFAARADAQLLIDATDAAGRCHDQGLLGLENAPQGGLELIDITDVANPVEIGLISHIGESHTVNVDPKRPHIVYSVTSDSVSVDEEGQRANEDPAGGEDLNLDGFEVVDISSCMNFPAGTTVEAKRAQCRPEVFRYRYPRVDMALGHTLQDHIYACHELEVYPDDRLTCASGNASIVLDMSGVFDDNGTPSDYTDDRLRGQPLPCQVRSSSSTAPFQSGAMVTDCVDGTGPGEQDLGVPAWIESGSPSLAGVRWIGSVYHQGRGAGGTATPEYDSSQDIDFDHEAEFTQSGEHLIATDERGGGILPPGASCAPGVDNPAGNGGVHFYRVDRLQRGTPDTAEEAFAAYAQAPGGGKAIYRAEIRTQPRATVCTAHVFHQIPGQNRIFMGWYSQGTQVIDFVEGPDGTVRAAEAGWFLPANANEWVSAIFRMQRNANGSYTYWGATGDFNLAEAGRDAIDIYRVTLPPPPPAGQSGVGGATGGGATPRGRCGLRINGRRTNDRLLGSIAGDRITGRAGNDRIKGRAGADCIRGQRGNDRLEGNTGRDLVVGGPGADVSRGLKGPDILIDRSRRRDVLLGGAARDRINARGGGRDVINCGAGRDVAIVGRNDRVRGCERVRRPRG